MLEFAAFALDLYTLGGASEFLEFGDVFLSVGMTARSCADNSFVTWLMEERPRAPLRDGCLVDSMLVWTEAGIDEKAALIDSDKGPEGDFDD